METNLIFLILKLSVSAENFVAQVDFAENYTIKHQGDVQSAHWATRQVTVFTMYAWKGNREGESYAIVSDDIEYNKYSVYTFLNMLLSHLKRSNTQLKTVTFLVMRQHLNSSKGSYSIT